MSVFLMFLVIVALLAFIGWEQYDHRQERERLINRIIATKASEVRVLDNEPRERTIRPAPVRDVPQEERDFWADFNGPVGL